MKLKIRKSFIFSIFFLLFIFYNSFFVLATDTTNIETVNIDGIDWSYKNLTDDRGAIFPVNSSQIKGDITIPSNIGNVEITMINDDAFRDCDNLRTVTIPNTVKMLGKNAFLDCSNLAEVNMSENVSTISNNCFKSCSNLKSFNMPKNIKVLNTSSFENCSNIKSIYFSNNDINIDTTAFRNNYITFICLEGSSIERLADDLGFNKLTFKSEENYSYANYNNLKAYLSNLKETLPVSLNSDTLKTYQEQINTFYDLKKENTESVVPPKEEHVIEPVDTTLSKYQLEYIGKLKKLDKSNYDIENKTKIEEMLNLGASKINTATTSTEIDGIYNEVIAYINSLPTLIETIRKDNEDELSNYLDFTAYRTEDVTKMKEIINTAVSNIESMEDETSIQKYVVKIKNKLDEFKTDEYLTKKETEEALSTSKTDALKDFNEYVKSLDYQIDSEDELLEMFNNGINDIKSCKTTEDVSNTLRHYKEDFKTYMFTTDFPLKVINTKRNEYIDGIEKFLKDLTYDKSLNDKINKKHTEVIKNLNNTEDYDEMKNLSTSFKQEVRSMIENFVPEEDIKEEDIKTEEETISIINEKVDFYYQIAKFVVIFIVIITLIFLLFLLYLRIFDKEMYRKVVAKLFAFDDLDDYNDLEDFTKGHDALCGENEEEENSNIEEKPLNTNKKEPKIKKNLEEVSKEDEKINELVDDYIKNYRVSDIEDYLGNNKIDPNYKETDNALTENKTEIENKDNKENIDLDQETGEEK